MRQPSVAAAVTRWGGMMLLAILICPEVFSQVTVTAVPVSKTTTKAVLGGRLAKSVTLWTITLYNASGELISVSPNAVLGRLPQIRPLDNVIAGQVVTSAQAYSILERVFRLLGDGSSTAGFLATGKVFPIKPVVNVVLVGAAWGLPYAAQRIKGIEVPVTANYTALAWSNSLSLSPGSTGLAHMLSEPWLGIDAITVVIDTTKATVTTTKAMQ